VHRKAKLLFKDDLMKLLISTFFLLFINTVWANSTPHELIVKLKPGFALPKLENVKSIQNLFENVYVLRTENLALLEASVKNNPAFLYTERNFHSEKRPLPKAIPGAKILNNNYVDSPFNDPSVSELWSFNDPDKNGISVNSAYKMYSSEKLKSTPVIVAVVDTGVDITHEDLKDVIWVNKREIPNNGIDDDRNGYVDDVNGINTLTRDANGKATLNLEDTQSHGTHVSGTIGATQNNGIGIAGIASNVKIMVIKTVPDDGDETDVDVAEAFVYAAKNGAKIINCSFGKSSNEGQQLIPDTLKYIGDKYGVLVIAASGNDSEDIDVSPSYPSNHPNENLLIVASTTSRGKMSDFSNYGALNVDVAAPGSYIYSTTPGNTYDSMSGTSMATPTTVGVAAEILSHYPRLSALSLKEILIKSVTIVDELQNKMISGGRIDLLKSLQLAKEY
jgi:subtilisin family serine protease